MSKESEIKYVSKLAGVLNISVEEACRSVAGKPFSERRRGWYLMDVGQILKLLPEPPARLLDLGVGPGWTSRMFALSGYDVVGLDISGEMIDLAQKALAGALNPAFYVHDYEERIDFGLFDVAVIYDALHHAIDEERVVKNVFTSLKPSGIFVSAEPGAGHSKTPESLNVIANFGTTEKDMEFERQKKMLRAAGFSTVQQYYRLSELPLEDVSSTEGQKNQMQHFSALAFHTLEHGFTSVVVAVK